MFGLSAIGSGTLNSSANRMFRIEVEGMGQNVDPDTVSYRIRSTRKTYLSVPYNRMSQEMQRINRMGGKILSIEPLSSSGAKEEATQAAKQEGEE